MMLSDLMHEKKSRAALSLSYIQGPCVLEGAILHHRVLHEHT